MSTERFGRTLLVATAVALFCSLLVSAAVTYLRPIQVAWEEIGRNRVILELAGLLDSADSGTDREAAMAFRQVSVQQVALGNGGQAEVFLRMHDGTPVRVILPLEGQGMWDTIRGFIALQGDCQTVAGIAITGHGETPGIGDVIEDPDWRASWTGKQVLNEHGQVALAPGDDPLHGFDAVSGATITVDAVAQAVSEDLGELGFGGLLDRCRAGEDWP